MLFAPTAQKHGPRSAGLTWSQMEQCVTLALTAIVNPGAMMVHLLHTAPARAAVVGPRGLDAIALRAKPPLRLVVPVRVVGRGVGIIRLRCVALYASRVGEARPHVGPQDEDNDGLKECPVQDPRGVSQRKPKPRPEDLRNASKTRAEAWYSRVAHERQRGAGYVQRSNARVPQRESHNLPAARQTTRKRSTRDRTGPNK